VRVVGRVELGAKNSDVNSYLDGSAAVTAGRDLPPGLRFEWTELTLQQILAGNTAPLVFGLGTLLVFLVFCCQYGSWSLRMAIISIISSHPAWAQ
jgi:multidrug efflux pump subunit AcrB